MKINKCRTLFHRYQPYGYITSLMAAQCFFTSDMLTSSCGYHTACIHRLKKEFWTIVFPFLQDKDYYNAICLGHFHRIRQLVAHRRSTSCKPNQLNESFFFYNSVRCWELHCIYVKVETQNLFITKSAINTFI